jgi:hypothetical protein
MFRNPFGVERSDAYAIPGVAADGNPRAAVRRCGKAVQVVYLFLFDSNQERGKGDTTYERKRD